MPPSSPSPNVLKRKTQGMWRRAKFGLQNAIKKRRTIPASSWKKSLSLEKRKTIAENLKDFRRRTDKVDGNVFPRGKTWNMRRGFADYEMELGFKKEGLKREFEHMLSGKRNLHILDVGFGQGIFMDEVRSVFGKRVKVEGLGVVRPPHSRTAGRTRVGWVEAYPLAKKKYDMIFCVGTVNYSSNRSLALQNMLNALSVGGRAYISAFFSFEPGINRGQLIHEMKKHGRFIFEPTKGTEPAGLIIFERNSRKAIDLSAFFHNHL